jgi:flagellar biosynthesis protein FlhB
MADWDNRTMPASPRRRLEARQRGEVAQSRLLRAAGQLLVVVVALGWLGAGVVDAMAGMMRTGLQGAAAGIDGSGAGVVRSVGELVSPTAMAVLPVLLVSVVVAVLVSLLQTGWLWSPGIMSPRWDRLDLSSGLSRMVGEGSGGRVLAVVGQLVIIASLGGWYVASRWGELLTGATAAGTTSSGLVEWLMRQGLQLAGGVAVGLLVLGGLDWGRQWWRQEQRLKMTPEEWRQEQRLEQTRRPRPARPTATFQQSGQSVD